MLPLYDNVRSHRFPVMNWISIGLNILLFWYTLRLGSQAREMLYFQFGMVAFRLNWLQPITFIPLITSIFLHGGWFHLISNVWTLFIFGDNIEDCIGSIRYLIFYLIGGIIAGLLQASIIPNSKIPAIGASGAIAGVLGGHFLLYPRARVISLIPIFIFPWIVELPSLIYLGIWFISQLYSGLFSLSTPLGTEMTRVAWWAHIGGFIFGSFFINVFIRKQPPSLRVYPNVTW